MRLAGEGQRHHGAAVESVFEGDDAGPFRVDAGNLDRVLNRLGAAVHEDCLLRELARSGFVHALGEADVEFIGRNLHAGVQEAVELFFDRADHFVAPMASVRAPNAAREVQVAIAVNVLEPGVFGLGHIDGRAVGKAAGHGLRAALRKGLGLGARNGSAKLDGSHRDSRR